MANFTLNKTVYNSSIYKNVIDTNFHEFVIVPPTITENPVTVDQFFSYYDQLFFDIPVVGSINSHTYLVTKSQEYIGGSVIDAEKQALIEEINSLRQQILDLSQTYLTISKIV
jgi:hypothetical protein